MPTPLEHEIAVNRLNTDIFIRQNPVSVALRTRATIQTPSGGSEHVEAETRQPQTFRLIMQSPAGASIEQRTEFGETERRIDYVLLGSWDAEVDVGDFWERSGVHFEVMSLIPWNGYEVRANVEANGLRP